MIFCYVQVRFFSGSVPILLTSITHVCVYIYIYAVVLLSGPSLAFWGVIIWAKFAFYKTLFVKKHYKYTGFSTFCKTNCARKFEVLLSGPSWSFLRCSQLGPDNNTYLAQIITPQNAFFVFLLLKISWNTYFYSVFWTSTKIWQKKGQNKNDNFSHFAKHRFIKNPFCCNLFFFCFFFVLFHLFFLKLKTLMLNKKHNLKSGKSKDKKKGFETEKQDRKPKERENISGKKEIAIENVHVVLFRKQKQRRKKNEKETKTRN